MRNLRRCLIIALSVALAIGPLAAVEPAESIREPDLAGDSPELVQAAAPTTCPEGQIRKLAKLRCKKGARGAAVGEYGGVPVSLFCDSDGTSTEFCAVGEQYSFRMGSETDVVAVDCFFPGEAPRVNEVCDAVRLTIR